jgi:hypothetical protein
MAIKRRAKLPVVKDTPPLGDRDNENLSQLQEKIEGDIGGEGILGLFIFYVRFWWGSRHACLRHGPRHSSFEFDHASNGFHDSTETLVAHWHLECFEYRRGDRSILQLF